jgi:hypothetical protein
MHYHGTTWWRRNKYNVYYLVPAIVTICVPLLVHPAETSCQVSLFHSAIFHTQTWESLDWGLGLEYSYYELWELAAIAQALIFSVVLLFEPREQRGIRAVMLLAFVELCVCLAAAICLGTKYIREYQWMVGATLVMFTVADFCMYRMLTEREELLMYKRLIFYVDVPIIITYGLITIRVGVPIDSDYIIFFSGAIAFQLIMGNIMIFVIRAYRRIETTY